MTAWQVFTLGKRTDFPVGISSWPSQKKSAQIWTNWKNMKNSYTQLLHVVVHLFCWLGCPQCPWLSCSWLRLGRASPMALSSLAVSLQGALALLAEATEEFNLKIVVVDTWVWWGAVGIETIHVDRIKQQYLKPDSCWSPQCGGVALSEALLGLFLPYTSNFHISETSVSKNDTGRGHLIKIHLSRLWSERAARWTLV